jgi:predicted nucleic acid-binding protein
MTPRSSPAVIDGRPPNPPGAVVASRELFVDTSAWFPLMLRRHADHAPLTKALRKRITSGDRVVTTNLVLAETYTLLLYRGHRDAALTFLRSARVAPNVVVTSTAELERRALTEWLEPFDDQRFSFTDAVSFAVMRERGITRALTLDTHFAIAGFSSASS